ncbi:hypothetical protein NM688_g2529 [Phlebia brevispora]|uniref:Uncharacterized protein n=1 Tax=Phlebia brevispora TaxID=194682 RepID=A0ACC1T8D9_9APHY|nr:hypothetical protein NM688_g2529 [Phlebia brevispora]
MTVTLRIQYKGDAARKLAAEEGRSGGEEKSPYLDEVTRALSLFQIPSPNYTRAIYKSGFILCNYNTTKDTKLYYDVWRGARRAQSVACRNTLDGLSISKPVFFQNKYANQEAFNTRGRGGTPYQPRPRSLSPDAGHHRYRGQSLSAERTWPSITSTSATNPLTSPGTGYQSVSKDRYEGTARIQRDVAVEQSPTKPSAGIGEAHKTLQILSHSRSLQALLETSSPAPDRPIKQEDTLSPVLHTPRVRLSSPKAPNTSSLSGSSSTSARQSTPSAQPSNAKPMSASYKDRTKSFERKQNTDISGGSYIGRTSSQQALKASSTSQFRPNSPPPVRRFSRFDMQHAPQTRPEHISPYRAPYRVPARSVSPVDPRERHDGLRHRPVYIPLAKRPLSPGAYRRRSASPPHKKRFFEYGLASGSKQQETHHPQIPTQPRAAMAAKRSLSPSRLERPGSPMRRTLTTSSGLRSAGSTAGGAVIKKTPSPPDDSTSQKSQTQTLNRELWDVRRQITALNAREKHILNELKLIRAPELVQSTISSIQTPDEKLKIMELEIVSLRERLQNETVRRKLVEDSCESERRRRRYAEDMLDDAKRESNTPLVVPAMLDAFQKIARLTGDALMTAED